MKNLYSVCRHAVVCLFVFYSSSLFSQQIAKSLTCSTGDQVGFLEYKPPTYDQDGSKKYPVIIFLHGIGERGNGTTDLQNITAWGIPANIKAGANMTFTWNGKTETFIVISPQCPVKYGMWPADMVNDFVTYAKTQLRGDPNRIILTGLSMGGGGTMRYVSDANPEYAKNLAAAAPISMPCTFGTGTAAAAAHLPVWLFHAKDDPTASSTCSVNAYNGLLNSQDPIAPLLTMWPTGGHNVWYRLYSDVSYVYQDVVNIYEWFLAQNKSLAPNKLPVANAGTSASVPPGVIQLNGSASKDPDGKIVRYVWKKLSGPASGTITTPRGASPATTVTGVTLEGTYQYELAVADDRASFSRATVTFTVTNKAKGQEGAVPGNNAPVANAGADVNAIGYSNVQLNAGTSSDKDGWIASVLWTKVSGPSAYSITAPTARVTEATGLVNGTYVFRVAVTDDKGATSYDDKTIVVTGVSGTGSSGSGTSSPGNASPVASAGVDVNAIAYNTVQLNASLSTDKDGWITKVQWSKVSGPASYAISAPTALITVATGLVNGTYVFRATVTDNKGATAYDDKTIVVTGMSGSSTSGAGKVSGALTVNAGSDVTLKGWNSEQLNASLSSVKNGGWYTSIKWTKISGPATYSITSPNALVAAASNLVVGVYVFRVTITDNHGSTAYDDKTITVQSVPANSAAAAGLIANAGTDKTLTGWNQEQLNASLSKTAYGGWMTAYKWTKISGPSSYTIVAPTTRITYAKNLAKGTYIFRVTVTDNRGYTAYDDKVVTVLSVPSTSSASVLDTTSGEGVEAARPPQPVIAEGSISVFPNPAVSIIHLEYALQATGKTFINIYDVAGKLVKSVSTNKDLPILQQDIDISSLGKGMYLIMAGTENKRAQPVKFVKQ